MPKTKMTANAHRYSIGEPIVWNMVFSFDGWWITNTHKKAPSDESLGADGGVKNCWSATPVMASDFAVPIQNM